MAKQFPTLVSVTVLAAAIVAIRLSASLDSRFVILTVAVVCGSVATLTLYRVDRLGTLAIVGIGLGLRILLLPLQPNYSDDAYRYLWDGSLVASGINPYLETPQSIVSEEDKGAFPYSELNSKRYHSVYPPVSQYVFAAASWLGGGNWQTRYLAMKLLLVLFEFLAVLLLARHVARRALLLYTLNPIVIFEVAGQAHTESILVPFLVATVVLVRNRRSVIAGFTLASATMVKLFPILLLPALVKRTGYRSLIGFFGGMAVVGIPFFSLEAVRNVMSSLRLYIQLFEFNAGLYLSIKSVARFATGLDISKQLGPLMAFAGLGAIVYWYRHQRNTFTFETAGVVVTSALLVCATTVHPWYLVPLLALVAFTNSRHWHWQWLSASVAGTYLLYSGGPYSLFVLLGWGGALILWLVYSTSGDRVVQAVLRHRAAGKARRVLELCPVINTETSVLDIGSGEGYVADELNRLSGAPVQLIDTIPANRTDKPFLVADAETLPLRSGSFDYAMMNFVLHHCRDQVAVLSEAVRCTSRGIVIVESTFRSNAGQITLDRLDRLANRIRSRGRMNEQEEYLHFRSVAEWRSFFESNGLTVVREEQWGTPIHRQVGFLLNAGPLIEQT